MAEGVGSGFGDHHMVLCERRVGEIREGNMPKLGVNIDHVATLRQARRESDPDPVAAVEICEQSGADSIVAHLREDRRHIGDKDVWRIQKIIKTRFNLEMSLNKGIVDIALDLKPHQATLVPERRQEITTEGGLDVVAHFNRTTQVTQKLLSAGIEVSLFIDASKSQILASHKAGARIIELHTGRYDRARRAQSRKKELAKLIAMTQYAISLGMEVNAGHGLKYDNTAPIAHIKGMHELNIGHAIIARALFVGLSTAVKEMKAIVKGRRK